jgi:uncharacterized protein
VVVSLTKTDGTPVCARCTLADTPLVRLRGLLGRSSILEDEGMLFRPTGSIHTFFMRFAIDAVFCDSELRVLKVVTGLRPWRMAAARGGKVVVELASGAGASIEPGDQLVIQP